MDLGSKKLLCAGVCFLAATAFVILGKAEFQAWADFTNPINLCCAIDFDGITLNLQ